MRSSWNSCCCCWCLCCVHANKTLPLHERTIYIVMCTTHYTIWMRRLRSAYISIMTWFLFEFFLHFLFIITTYYLCDEYMQPHVLRIYIYIRFFIAPQPSAQKWTRSRKSQVLYVCWVGVAGQQFNVFFVLEKQLNIYVWHTIYLCVV